jgi:hypothetical protein
LSELLTSVIEKEWNGREPMRIVTINNKPFEVIEDENKIFYKDISEAKNRAHFSFSKNEEDNKEAELGLKIFFSELFRD